MKQLFVFAAYLLPLENLKIMMMNLLCVFLISVVFCEEKKSDAYVRHGNFVQPARVSNVRYNGYNGFMNLGGYNSGYNTGYYTGQITQNQ